MREEIAISQEWSALINSEIESGLLRYHSNHVTNVRLYPQQVFSISVAILSVDDSFPNPFAESLQHGFRNFAQCNCWYSDQRAHPLLSLACARGLVIGGHETTVKLPEVSSEVSSEVFIWSFYQGFSSSFLSVCMSFVSVYFPRRAMVF